MLDAIGTCIQRGVSSTGPVLASDYMSGSIGRLETVLLGAWSLMQHLHNSTRTELWVYFKVIVVDQSMWRKIIVFE